MVPADSKVETWVCVGCVQRFELHITRYNFWSNVKTFEPTSDNNADIRSLIHWEANL